MLIVEDGSGLSDADSYVSIDDATTYLTKYKSEANLAIWTLSLEQERALRSATQYIDVTYGPRFQGYKVLRTMSLQWPRYGAIDSSGYQVSWSSVPIQVVNATIEMAWQIANGEDPLAKLEQTAAIASQSVTVGPISESTSYVGGLSATPVYQSVERILATLLGPANVVYPG